MKIDSIAIIGLGYVGLPLACALARHYDLTGFDLSQKRVDSLNEGVDYTGEVDKKTITSSKMTITTNREDINSKSLYIITVPTPVDSDNKPDLGPTLSACSIVGKAMGKGSFIVLESTVYPGVTMDVCGPELEKVSGLKCGVDFFMGYSPERINPGDKEHTLAKITKLVAGQNEETLKALVEVYEKVAPVFPVKDIKVAEAAKVIENAQRDINIAFVNELAMIFDKLDIDTHATLEAAGTKWNFLGFKPGLVGGHCIGVDPYYLTHAAQEAGYHPEMILAGRRINDNMGKFIGSSVANLIAKHNLPKRALALGLTFKENVSDLRNSKSATTINELIALGIEVDVYDPMADSADAKKEYGLDIVEPSGKYGAIVALVCHNELAQWDKGKIESHLVDGGLVADIKAMWADKNLSENIITWSL